MSRVNPIIVNYRTADLTLKCVRSIITVGVAPAEDIIVVDNASPDDSADRLSRELPIGVRLVASSMNAGFSAGVNLGAKGALGEYLLVLNPDTYFEDLSFARVIDILDCEQEIGLVGLDLFYPNGERQYSARRFYCILDILCRRLPIGRYGFARHRSDRHLMKFEWRSGVPFSADWVMGTGFVVRRDLFNRIGGMDEAYFLYMEDVELCARVWAAGHRVVGVPDAKLVHDHQRSSASGPLSLAGRMHIASLREFMKKYRVPIFTPPDIDRVRRSSAANSSLSEPTSFSIR